MVTNEYQTHIGELLAPLGPLSIRRMFSGAGVFLDGKMFALIIDDVTYLKTDEPTKAAFIVEGSKPFSYATKLGRRSLVNYYELPERLFDEPEELVAWAKRAAAIAISAPVPKAKKKSATRKS